jgi:hypothetical protein
MVQIAPNKGLQNQSRANTAVLVEADTFDLHSKRHSMGQLIAISRVRSGKYFVVLLFIALLAYVLLSGKGKRKKEVLQDDPEPLDRKDTHQAADSKVKEPKKKKSKKSLTPIVTPTGPSTPSVEPKSKILGTIEGEKVEVEEYVLPEDSAYHSEQPEKHTAPSLTPLPPSKDRRNDRKRIIRTRSMDGLLGPSANTLAKNRIHFVDETGDAPDMYVTL